MVMVMPPTNPTASGSGDDTSPKTQSKAGAMHQPHNNNTGRSSSPVVTPRVIFDFRCPPSSTSSNGNGNGSSSCCNGHTPTKARRHASPKKSTRLHHVKWTPVPPLPSSWKVTTSSSNGYNHKRVHDKKDTLRSRSYSPKMQRTSSMNRHLLPSKSSSALPQSPPPPPRTATTHGALYHRLLFTLLSFITIPILLSTCIHFGYCTNVESNLVLSPQTTIQESACHVSSIAIIHILHHLPKDAQLLVERVHHFIGTIIVGVDRRMTMTIHKNDDWKKTLFQRVTADHAKKHQDRTYNNDKVSSSSSSSASEEIDRMHPIRHILEGASIYTHVRKQKQLMKLEVEKKKIQQHFPDDHDNLDGDAAIVIDWKKWKYAMSDDYELSSEEIFLVQTLAERVLAMSNTLVRCSTAGEDANAISTECNPEDDNEMQRIAISSLSDGLEMPYRPFHERVDSVAWGGELNHDTDMSWWPKQNDKDISSTSTTISYHSEGGRLLAGYLKIMKWPSDLHVKFPFRLCAGGCDSEVAVLHTLEWREKYKPWCVSEETVRFNNDGFIYARGHSRPGSMQRVQSNEQTTSLQQKAGHSMVWLRPGLASPTENLHQYIRSVIHAIEMAVSDSLHRNAGTIGRFNVVIDCANMSSKNSPSMSGVKILFSVLQDHFPDRLGVLLLANLSGLTQLLLKMVLPFVTEEVRAKIHIIPNDEVERRMMLQQFIDEKHIPYYLGGKDEYEFDAAEYYQEKCILSEDGIKEYLTTMPYHA